MNLEDIKSIKYHLVQRMYDGEYFFCLRIDYDNCIIVDKVSYTVIDYIPFKSNGNKKGLGYYYMQVEQLGEEMQDYRYDFAKTRNHTNITVDCFDVFQKIIEEFDPKVFKKMQKDFGLTRPEPVIDENHVLSFFGGRDSDTNWRTAQYRYDSILNKLLTLYDGKIIHFLPPGGVDMYIRVSDFMIDYSRKWLPVLKVRGERYVTTNEHPHTSFSFSFTPKDKAGAYEIGLIDDVMCYYKKCHSYKIWSVTENPDDILKKVQEKYDAVYSEFRNLELFKLADVQSTESKEKREDDNS